MAIREILLLGNPRLYEGSEPVLEDERETLRSVVIDLHDTLTNFRKQYGAGRAIAAPQIGVMKRIIYLSIDEHLYKPSLWHPAHTKNPYNVKALVRDAGTKGGFSMCPDDNSTVFINPQLEKKSEEMMEVWDDCMCFPDLLVKVMRHYSCRIRYRNQDWEEESSVVQGDLSELLQHEYDHLDGILATSRAIDGESFALKSQRRPPQTG